MDVKILKSEFYCNYPEPFTIIVMSKMFIF